MARTRAVTVRPALAACRSSVVRPTTAGVRVSVSEAAQRLRAGDLVAIPTETVYGLAGRALDEGAVARIFETKGRPRFDPLIVHVSSAAAVEPLARALPARFADLAEAFWPGPLTLVLEKSDRVPDLVTAGAPTVAVRVPGLELTRALLDAVGEPLAAPSANRFGRLSPTTPDAVEAQLGAELPVLDGGPCPVGVESTIVSLAHDPPLLLRPGGVSVEALAPHLPGLRRAAADELATASPGRLPQHYAPATPMRWDDGKTPSGRHGALVWSRVPSHLAPERAEILTPSGDPVEAARNLFEALRRLDAAKLPVVVVERMPEAGLGLAIADRLQRAMRASS